MRKYEIVIVYHPELTKEQLDEEVKKVELFFQERKVGSLETVDWGRKELPHLAKHQRHGLFKAFYITTEDTDINKDLAAILRINDKILKFQAHKTIERRRRVRTNPHKKTEAGADLVM